MFHHYFLASCRSSGSINGQSGHLAFYGLLKDWNSGPPAWAASDFIFQTNQFFNKYVPTNWKSRKWSTWSDGGQPGTERSISFWHLLRRWKTPKAMDDVYEERCIKQTPKWNGATRKFIHMWWKLHKIILFYTRGKKKPKMHRKWMCILFYFQTILSMVLSLEHFAWNESQGSGSKSFEWIAGIRR